MSSRDATNGTPQDLVFSMHFGLALCILQKELLGRQELPLKLFG